MRQDTHRREFLNYLIFATLIVLVLTSIVNIAKILGPFELPWLLRILDPVVYYMAFDKDVVLPNQPVIGDARYEYIMNYPIPYYICYRVELDVLARRPVVLSSTPNLPTVINFNINSPKLLTKYDYVWAFEYCKFVQGQGVIEIIYKTSGPYPYHQYFGAVGDGFWTSWPPAAKDSFYVRSPGGFSKPIEIS